MNRICVATSDGRAYYAIVLRLRNAGLQFLSPPAGGEIKECDLVVTTRAEADSLGVQTIALEDLDENPDIVRGQVFSLLTGGDKALLVGLDPGSRTGMAVFLGEIRLASHTFNSKSGVCATVVKFVEGVPSPRSVVRIGDGDPSLAAWLAQNLTARLPKTIIEIVDESGTSRNLRVKGLQKDQGSAVRIALRKGRQFKRAQVPRSR